MTNKVIFIGIDSMDSLLLSKYIDELPNFKRLYSNTPKTKMVSVFPPDSDTAWASIYTGLNPAKHGVVNFVDPIEKSVNIQTEDVDTSYIKGKTFWDYASKNGKKACILLPHICYPPWDINGVMVSRSKIKDSVLSSPGHISNKYDLDILNTPKGVPRKREGLLKKLVETYEKLVLNETEFFLKMINKNDWDLFFAYSSALDAIQHYFWNYCDENDTEYPGDNPFKNVIKDFYKLYDEMIGKLINSIQDTGVTTIILSDHGHGRRPLTLLNINEVLRQFGFLNTKNNLTVNIIEKMKVSIAKWINKYNLGWMASKVLKFIPQSKNLYSKPLSIDWESTIAYTTDLSGIKAYTYGGVKINRENLKSDNYYDNVREKIINIISDLKDKNDKKVVKWVMKREELYQGLHITKYPDIVIQLEEDYGIGQKVNSPIIDKAYTSSVVPGSHRGDTPIFFILNPGKEIKKDYIALVDIAPTVIDLLGINWKRFDFDGESILGK